MYMVLCFLKYSYFKQENQNYLSLQIKEIYPHNNFCFNSIMNMIFLVIQYNIASFCKHNWISCQNVHKNPTTLELKQIFKIIEAISKNNACLIENAKYIQYRSCIQCLI